MQLGQLGCILVEEAHLCGCFGAAYFILGPTIGL